MPGATPAAGATAEHPLRRETAGLAGVAPGTTGGAIPAARSCRYGRSAEQARGVPARRAGRRDATRAATGGLRTNRMPARRMDARTDAGVVAVVRMAWRKAQRRARRRAQCRRVGAMSSTLRRFPHAVADAAGVEDAGGAGRAVAELAAEAPFDLVERRQILQGHHHGSGRRPPLAAHTLAAAGLTASVRVACTFPRTLLPTIWEYAGLPGPCRMPWSRSPACPRLGRPRLCRRRPAIVQEHLS